MRPGRKLGTVEGPEKLQLTTGEWGWTPQAHHTLPRMLSLVVDAAFAADDAYERGDQRALDHALAHLLAAAIFVHALGSTVVKS